MKKSYNRTATPLTSELGEGEKIRRGSGSGSGLSPLIGAISSLLDALEPDI